ncbi:MAG: site-specific integrase [Thermoguttaceae bacterium]|jgi:integrase
MKNRNEREKSDQSLERLVEETMERLKRLGYCAKAISNYLGIWNTFVRFVQQSDAPNSFSVEAVEKYLAHRGLPGPGAKSLRASQVHIRAAMRILTECALHGCFQRRRNMAQKSPLGAMWEHLLDGYEQFCRKERRTAPRCLRVQQHDVHRFLCFLEARGIKEPRAIDVPVLSAFVRSLTQLKPKTLATTVSRIRGFLRFLCVRGLIDGALISQIPKVRVYQGERLPTTWTSEAIQALLAAVDRASPLGKRDYAILLLAARLGLRAGDIREMRLDQLDWEQARIHVVQGKTGVPLELPLTEEVGEAIIDYLRHGRPPVAHREVFLRQNAPFEPFGQDNNLHSIITSYRRKAGIELPAQSRRGLHSLRHTLASRLLEAGVPLDTIAGTLGHLAPETTRLYLRIDVNDLRRAALDPEEVLHG